MTWLQRWRFLALLLTLVMLLVVYPVLSDVFDARLLLDALLSVVFLCGSLVIFSQRHLRLVALVLGIPTLAGLWTGYAFPGLPRQPLALGFHVCAVLFFGFTVAVILLAVHKEETVSADAIYGAFCGYLLTGLLFGHLYGLVESLSPGSFQGNADFTAKLQDEDHRHFVLTYFSFVTLTTVGYGDITPSKNAGRGLAVVEAIMGQFYIAVLVAELIGKRVAQAITGPGPESKG